MNLCIGLPANLVSLMTMLRMAKSTCTVCVALLAVADMVYIAVWASLNIARPLGGEMVCKLVRTFLERSK